MVAKNESLTQLAYRVIENDVLRENKYLDANEVLDYLEDNKHFKTLQELLKETMIDAKILEENAPASLFINTLYDLLSKQDSECNRQKPRHKNTIRRWFADSSLKEDNKNKANTIRYREDAISICFALNLCPRCANVFLNKSGHSTLNIRNVDDAVYTYCLLNKKPLSAALRILDKYHAHNPSPLKTPVTASSGGTTTLLKNQLLGNSSWESEDDFLSTFLIPNKSNFISYSKTAIKEYHLLKNPIYLIALKKWLISELNSFEFRKKEEYVHKNIKGKNDFPVTTPMSDVQVTYNFINNLKKYAEKDPLFQCAANKLVVITKNINPHEPPTTDTCKTDNNCLEIMDLISSESASRQDDDQFQAILSQFLSETLTAYRMLIEWLPSVVLDDGDPSNDHRQRSYSDSSLKDTVLNSFPQRHTFTKIENSPENQSHKISLRKTIILLFYMNYAYSWTISLRDDHDNWGESELGLEDFMARLNIILQKCHLGTLYPANQFDWLILRSICDFEVSIFDPDQPDDNPISFLNDVIASSFGENMDF